MPAVFTVDQAATFKSVFFLSSEPKMAFGKQGVQESASDGTPKWQVQVAAGFEQFGRTVNEILVVTMTSGSDPAGSLGGMPQPVQFGGFRVGVSPVEKRVDKDGRERITGGTAWYQADTIRSLMGAPAKKSEV